MRLADSSLEVFTWPSGRRTTSGTGPGWTVLRFLSLNITFIDFGNSVTVNLEHILEETDDIPTEELEMVDDTVWKYEKETIYVNGKPVIVGKNLPAKTVLSMFCEQNNLSYPNYQLTVENENNPE